MLITLAAFILLSFSSCRKNILDDYPEFEGFWESSNAVMNIDSDGFASYEMYATTGSFSVSETAEGRLKIKDGDLIIKSIVSKRFGIDV